MANVSRKTGFNPPMEPIAQYLVAFLINAVISVVLGFVSGCGGWRNTIRVLRGDDDLDNCVGQLLRDDLGKVSKKSGRHHRRRSERAKDKGLRTRI